MKQLLELWFCQTLVCLLIIGGKEENLVLSVPIEFDDIDSAYDLDTEQSEARYDPRLLSQELQTSELDSQGAAESCVSANRSFEHGAKLPRLDPCEICLCIDGEVFCWWKQCEIPIKKPSKTKLKKPTAIKNHSKPLNFSSKSMENVPNSILSFPQNLPLHLSLLNDTGEEKLNKKTTHLSTPKKYLLPILSSTTTVSSSTGASKSKAFGRLQTIKHTVEATNKFNVPENILNSNVPPIIINSKYSTDTDTYQPSLQTTENSFPNEFLQPIASEKYQINNQTTLHGQQHRQFHKPPQHYIITSSGNIEMDPEPEDGDTDEVSTHDNAREFVTNKNDDTDDNNNYQKYVNDWSDSGKINDETSSNINDSNDNINYNSTAAIAIPMKNETPSSVSVAASTMEQHNSINQQMSPTALQNNPTKQYNSSEILFSTLTDTLATQTSVSSAAVAAAAVVATATEMFSMKKMSSVPSTSILAETTTIVDTTTMSREKTCMVMGQIYGIGSMLPQETGNCLQCICTEGINVDDPPRVTCNPHNCPPLVLPDLFDNTGY